MFPFWLFDFHCIPRLPSLTSPPAKFTYQTCQSHIALFFVFFLVNGLRSVSCKYGRVPCAVEVEPRVLASPLALARLLGVVVVKASPKLCV